jgi:nicotinamide-nucleotide amidase
MAKSLIIVGNSIKYNTIFMDYIKRNVKDKIGHIDTIYHIDKNDKNLFLTIEEVILRSSQVVLASKDGYNLIGKILSTITEDNMVMKDGELIPSKSIDFDKDSYLIEHQSTKINVIRIEESKTLPKLLIDTNQKRVNFFLVDAQSQKYKVLLDELVSIYGVQIDRTTIIDGLEYLIAEGFLHDQQKAFIQALAFRFADKILFGSNLSEIISKKLIESGKKVTMMESCTGGLVASELVKNSGVSSIFNGSIVSYADAVKMRLGVSESTLKEHGAVSVQCVYEMLDGALKAMASDMAIAISGVAGPTGGSDEKPVGTVYVGAKSRQEEIFVEKLVLKGDRQYIQQQAMFWAFKLLVLSDKKVFFNFSLNSLDN